MKTKLSVIAALLLVVLAASGAEPVAVKGPIAAWYDKLPPPPKSAAEAASKIKLGKHCPATLDASLNAVTVQVEDYEQALDEYEDALKAQEAGETGHPAHKAYLEKEAELKKLLDDPKKTDQKQARLMALQKEMMVLMQQIGEEQQKKTAKLQAEQQKELSGLQAEQQAMEEALSPAMKALREKMWMQADQKKMKSMTPAQREAFQTELSALAQQVQAEQEKKETPAEKQKKRAEEQQAMEARGPATKAYMEKFEMYRDHWQNMTPAQKTALEKEMAALEPQAKAEQEEQQKKQAVADRQKAAAEQEQVKAEQQKKQAAADAKRPPEAVEAADVAAAVRKAEENKKRLRQQEGGIHSVRNALQDERYDIQQQIEEQVRSICKKYEKDPKGLKVCLLGQRKPCIKRRLELALKQLPQYQEIWPRKQAEFRTLAVEADRILAPVQYGDRARGHKARQTLRAYQEEASEPFYALLDLSTDAHIATGRWQLAQQLKDNEPGACECDFGAGLMGREYTSRERTDAAR